MLPGRELCSEKKEQLLCTNSLCFTSWLNSLQHSSNTPVCLPDNQIYNLVTKTDSSEAAKI